MLEHTGEFRGNDSDMNFGLKQREGRMDNKTVLDGIFLEVTSGRYTTQAVKRQLMDLYKRHNKQRVY